MEFALAEKSTYIPPLILGMIVLYRQLMYGFWYKHPIVRPIVLLTSGFQFIADSVMNGLTSFMSTSQEKALAVRNMSVAVLNGLMNTMQSIILYTHGVLSQIRFQAKNVMMVVSNMTAGVYSIFTKTSEAFQSIQFHFRTVVLQPFTGTLNSVLTKMEDIFHSIHFHFQTVIQQAYNFTGNLYSIITKPYDILHSIQFHLKTVVLQTYNFTATLFHSLETKAKETTTVITDYFNPKPKTLYEQIHIVSVVLFVCFVMALTVFYFSILRKKTVELPETPKKQVEPINEIKEPVAPRRNPVRRKTKAA